MKPKQFKNITDEMSEKIIETAEMLVTANGAHTITVRQILQNLGITNRVFYNRFDNIHEVLEIVYRRTILKIRESLNIKADIKSKKDFFEYIMDVVVHSLTSSYDHKMNFNRYVFENDCISDENFKWWCGEIKKLINFALEHKYIKPVNVDVLSYSVWCFVRGYNADAVSRNIPREEAVEYFRYSFGFLIEGLKA